VAGSAILWVFRLVYAVAVPVGGFIVADWAGAVLAVLAWKLAVELVLGPAAVLALSRLGDDPMTIVMLDAQDRVRRWRRRLAAIGLS
jgi:hypothetical protein